MYRLLIFTTFFCITFSSMVAQDSLYLFTEFYGENDQDQFGVVENVGDVNGDGYEDLMVGAPGSPRNLYSGPFHAYAKLYLGGIDFDTIPDLVFNDYSEFTNFGATIAGNGDLNGDGFSDFAIADPRYGDFNVGKVYIYFGGSELDTIPELELTLDPAQYFYTQLGFSMALNGDINDDGYNDLIVGAPFDDWGSNTNNIGFQNSHVFIDTSSEIGRPVKVVGLGDLDGNGFSDFALLKRDSAVVYFSPINENNFNTTTFHKPSSYDYLFNISPYFDINNDNKAELLICAGYNPNSYAEILLITYTDELDYTNIISYSGNKYGYASHLDIFENLLSDTISSIVIGQLEALFYEHQGNGKVYIYNTDYLLNPLC